MNYKVRHNQKRRRFEIELEGYTGYLEYVLGERTMDLIHTYVPEEIGGKGVAAALVEEVLTYARDNNMKIIPTCSYIELYLVRHQEYEPLVVD